MLLDVVTPATSLAVSLADAKAFMRVDYSYDDSVITALINAATFKVQQLCQKTLAPTGYNFIIDAFPVFAPAAFMQPPMAAIQLVFVNRALYPAFNQTIFLPFGPVTSVSSITYLDANSGTLTTLDPSQYLVLIGGNDGNAGSQAPARICPAYGLAFPIARYVPNCVTISYTAGYPTSPPHIQAAIKLLVAFMYEHRDTDAPIPTAVEALLDHEYIGSYH